VMILVDDRDAWRFKCFHATSIEGLRPRGQYSYGYRKFYIISTVLRAFHAWYNTYNPIAQTLTFLQGR
jgi:hypothetical protein